MIKCKDKRKIKYNKLKSTLLLEKIPVLLATKLKIMGFCWIEVYHIIKNKTYFSVKKLYLSIDARKLRKYPLALTC